ncbi:alpha/beta hydrolase (plasmid) [Rhodococcus sp. DMU1]|nr:alpha/beta hydrolase [Rhodococcus sp. DMU1]
MRESYLGGVTDRDDSLASPVLADLRGLPRTLVQTAELEALRPDAELFTARCAESMVDCSLQVWPGMIHVWLNFTPRLSEAAEALRAVADCWPNDHKGSVRSVYFRDFSATLLSDRGHAS